MCGLALLWGGASLARDLSGERGIVLSEESVAVLSRVSRQDPASFMAPIMPPEPQAVVEEETVPEVYVEQGSDSELMELDIASVDAPAPLAEEFEIAEADPEAVVDQFEYIEGDIVEGSVYDVPLETSKDGELYDDSIFSRQTPPALPQPEAAPPQAFNSSALSGYYAGVGIADGMILVLDVRSANVHGRFRDSAGQDFFIRGEVLSDGGQARMAIFTDHPIGVLEVQLTSLGLSTAFIPLFEDLSPDTSQTRTYDFLRVLSPEASEALEELRQTNAERREAAYRAQDLLENQVRMRFPGDSVFH